MTELTVELLTQADDATIRDLALLEIIAWGQMPDTERVEARKRDLGAEIGRPNFAAKGFFVGRQSGAVRGVCRIEPMRDTDDEWMVVGLAVHPDHRKLGIARVLVRACIRFAGSRGASVIRSMTHRDNQASIAFHRAVGFADEGGFVAPDGDEKVAFSMAVADQAGQERRLEPND